MSVNGAAVQGRRFPWRVPTAIAAVAVLLALAVAIPAKALPAVWPAAAVAPATGPDLALAGSGQSFTLTPDVPAYWQVGVTTRNVQLTALIEAVSASGTLAQTNSATPTTLSLAECDVAWQTARCPGTARTLLAATPLATLHGQSTTLAGATGIPADAYLLATVLMPTGGAAPGAEADVSIHVTAAGSELIAAPAGEQTGAVPPASAPGPLAQTGTRFGLSVVLAIAAIAAGWFLARLARRRAQSASDS